jgi:aldose 1-epimerase
VRGPDGRVVVRMAAPDGDRGVDVWLGPGVDYLQLFTGDALEDPAQRRRGLAVEPMTCPANAMRTGRGLVELAPGQEHEATWGLRAW